MEKPTTKKPVLLHNFTFRHRGSKSIEGKKYILINKPPNLITNFEGNETMSTNHFNVINRFVLCWSFNGPEPGGLESAIRK